MDTRDPLSIKRYFFRTGEKEIRVIYQKLFIMAFAPILLAVFVITFWGILLKKRNKLDQIETRFMATVVIIFFLIHPTITSMMIDLFNC